jgi:hypothetical protein
MLQQAAGELCVAAEQRFPSLRLSSADVGEFAFLLTCQTLT